MPTIPTDPGFVNQWYLRNTAAGQFDINVINVWDDYTGAGVTVTVFDDGFDYVHADLNDNYNTTLDYDYSFNDFDPAPGTADNHGTAVMGIIGAEQGNSYGGVGVAWGANLIGYRGFALSATDADDQLLDSAGLGDGIGNTNGNIGPGTDVISVSGGFGSTVFFNSTDAQNAVAALETIVEQGRGGLGVIYVKSSGNSRAVAGSTAREEGTAELMDSTKYSINVAAMRQDGWVTSYSTPGANVLVSAFADDTSNNGAIYTTDRTGAPGYNATDFTSGFNGTSAAAPQVSGIVALMLEANDQLGWRDVQEILAYSARHTGSAVGSAANTGAPAVGGFEQATQTNGSSWFWNAADNWNGGGMHFSNDYGFGMVDALAAVRLAETWELSQTSANDFETFEDDVNSTVTFDAATQTFTIGEITDIVIEHVSIELDFAHTWLADIELYLTSPEGTRVQLLADTGDSADFDGIWRFGTTAFWGESSAGDWTLTAVDDTGGDSFTIRDADLRTSGNPVTNDDLWIFTNEYSDYAGVAGHGTVFAGGVGVNTLNAAAVTSATTINLLTNTATIDGVSTTNSNITRVFTGDGNDTIVGDSVSRFLDGGRGVDTITGGSANEVIRGGLGDFSDILRGGAGQDSVYGGAGNDIFYFDAASDLVAGETYDGGTGVDSIVILGAGTFDFSTSTVTSTERFFFDNTAATNQTAVLNQSAALGLIPNGFVGNGGTNIVEVVLAASESTNLTNLGLSAWTSGSDQIRITGGSGTNIITGTTRDDSIGGNGGDDVIEGVWGMDSLYGGAGQDKLHVFAGSDIASGEVYDGGSENDSLYLNIKATGVTGSGGIFDFTTAVLTSLEEVDFWGTGAQTVTGVFLGTQFGSGLATTLRLDGWASTDIFQVELGDGEDIDLSGFTFSVFWTDGTDLVRVVGDLGNNEIVGTSRGDHITTGAGIDRLDGGLGADTLDGGLGNDVYTIDNVGDSIINEVTFSTGGGIDTVRSSITYTLGTNLEVLRLQGSANLNGFGNAAPESLVGNTGANTMGAGGGNDIINAKAGDDTLIGGTGRDTMVGDTGADVFVYNSFAESYAGAATRDFLNGFTHGQDVIDLSAIDANPFNAGDQAFTFIGSAAFTGAGSNSAGQLRYFTFSGGNFNIVQADWNGDGVPEMEIFVNGTNFMTGTDFIL